MCRQNQLFGCALMAFGLGVLIGLWLEQGFVCACLGFGLLIFGFCIVRKK